jgi:prepilin-type processing-associated H-X9-DG protein
MYNGMFYTDYNHDGPPNDPRPSCDGGSITGGFLGLHPPRSFHGSSANVLFGDAHVEPITGAIALETWRAMGTHRGGE